MEARLGEDHSGKLRHETATAKAERIIAEELKRAKWKPADLNTQAKGHRVKNSAGLAVEKRDHLDHPGNRGALEHGQLEKL